MANKVDPTLLANAEVRISIADLKIHEAVDHVADGDAHYLRWMPAIIDRFRVTYAEYWDLTVAEHQTFIDYLEQSVGGS